MKINGGVKGFFKGRSGVRQSDPLSPFLFVLGMEVLYHYLRVITNTPLVSYHPKCSKINLTHLVFADDLMVFVSGDVPSVVKVLATLQDFAAVSGLHLNPEKTNIYFGGVASHVKEEIIAVTHFIEGKFPF